MSKGTAKVSRSVQAHIYLVLTSQIQARSNIVGNSESAVDVQQVFMSTFDALINEDYFTSVDTDRYQGFLEHAFIKCEFLNKHRHLHASK